MNNYNNNNKNQFGGRQGGNSRESDAPRAFFDKGGYQPVWIEKEADEAMVLFAEKMGQYMADAKLTNSKIRSIYGEIKRIQMGEFEKERSSFYLLRPKVAYALGREKASKGNKGYEGLELFKIIFDESSKSVSDTESFKNFCNLFEAILAYHKAYGGKD